MLVIICKNVGVSTIFNFGKVSIMKKVSNQLNFIIGLGALIEYYDYIIFALLAKYIISAIFVNFDHSIFFNFIFYSLGRIAKPIGGLIFGHFADKYSEKKVILALTFVMSCATLSIGCLHGNWGDSINITLLFTLRAIQAGCLGAEIPCAATYAYNNSSDKRAQGNGLGAIFANAAIGHVFANFVLSVLTFYMTDQMINAWGWRIPILFGAFLGFVLLTLRTRLPQEFKKSKTEAGKYTMQMLLKELCNKKYQVIGLVMLVAFPAALICTNVYFAKYFPQEYGVSSGFVYSAQTISLVFAAFVCPFIGRFVVQSQSYHLSIMLLLFTIALPYFVDMIAYNYFSLVLFMVLWQWFISFCIISAMHLLISIMNVNNKFSCTAIVYGIGFIIGSFAPMLIEFTNSIYAGMVVFGIGAFISSLFIIRLKSKSFS